MRATCLWYTGIPASGKTTNAELLVKKLKDQFGLTVAHLDGDMVRETEISMDLGFSDEDRRTHLMRVASMVKILLNQGIWAICSFVSPSEKVRKEIADYVGWGRMMYVHVDTPYPICRQRDNKGLYAKAAKGEIKGLTGYDAPYEKPDSCLTIDGTADLESNVNMVLEYLSIPLFFNDENSPSKYLVFVGRWVPFHNGHAYIVKKAMADNLGCPVIIMVRNTVGEEISPQARLRIIQEWMRMENIPGYAWIIPDIKGIFYGRGVGYKVQAIDVPEEIKGISATAIRQSIKDKDSQWTKFVPESIVKFVKEEMER